MGVKTKQKLCNLSHYLTICQWGLNKMTRKLSEDSWSPGCDLDIASLCHKPEVSLLEPACSLFQKKKHKVPCYKECWVFHNLWTNSHMTLLYKLCRHLHWSTHLAPDHYHRQSAAAERRSSYFVTQC